MLPAAVLLTSMLALSACTKTDNGMVYEDPGVKETMDAGMADQTGAADENGSAQADTGEDQGNLQTADEEKYMKIYAPVLNETLSVIQNGYDFDKEYAYISGAMMERVMYADKDALLKSIGYLLMDVNGDGKPELLIGENIDYESDDLGERCYVYSCFAAREEKPVAAFEGMTRSSFEWLGDGQFYYMGSGGAFDTLFGTAHLNDEGTDLVWNDFYFTTANENMDGVYIYHNTEGVYDENASEKLDMTEEEFTKVVDEAYKQVLLTWKPIGEFEGSEWNVSSEDSGNSAEGTGGKGNEAAADSELLKELPGTWLYPNGANVVFESNGSWTLNNDYDEWLFGGGYETTVGGDGTVALRLYSEVGDAGNNKVADGKLHYDQTGYPVLDLNFEAGLTAFTDGTQTLNKALLSLHNAAGLSKEEMAKIAAGLGNVCASEYRDYDMDGVCEEFVATGQPDEMGGYLVDAVWYIASDGQTTKVGTDFKGLSLYESQTGYYMDYSEVGKGFFYADCGGYGSGWLTFVFGVKDGKPYELDVSMKIQGFYQDEPGVFTTTTDDYTDYHKYLITELNYDKKTEQFSVGKVTDRDRYGE